MYVLSAKGVVPYSAVKNSNAALSRLLHNCRLHAPLT